MAGGFLDEGVDPCQIRAVEAGVRQVDRSVEHGDADLGIADRLEWLKPKQN
ncbi:hypothetical protein [Streptomyces xanthophaeus]|uniref:hypothetical protein n=1 Tax=Streptomyces xanthophaeus TaxID=67385 RepID=UPI00386D7631